jgi:HEAT repeat protein
MKSPEKVKKSQSSQKALADLLERSRERDASVRVAALEALAKIDHPGVLDTMIRALSDKNPTVRVTAVESLGTLNYEQSVPQLIDRLADSNSEVRMRAAESLGMLMSGGSSPSALIKRLQDSDRLVRIAVAETLGAIGDQKALPALRQALRDASPLVRSYVSESIGRLGGKRDIAGLETALEKETSETAKVGFYYGLYLLGQHAMLQELLKLLQSTDYRVRCATANTLSQIPGDESEREVILRSLRKALRQEPTVAARSSIRSSLRRLSK